MKLQITNEEITAVYLKLCKELGIVATMQQVRQCNYMCSPDAIIARFGSFSEFQKQSGVMVNGELSGKMLKEEVEKRLVWTRITRGRRLDGMEINNAEGLPYINYIRRLYPGKSLGQIWEEIESKISPNIII